MGVIVQARFSDNSTDALLHSLFPTKSPMANYKMETNPYNLGH